LTAANVLWKDHDLYFCGRQVKLMAGSEQKTVEKRGGKRVTFHSLNRCHNPWQLLMSKRALRDEDKWVLRVIDQYKKQLAGDIRNPSATQQSLMELASLCRGCIALILASMVEKDDNGLMAELQRFVKLEISILSKLGITPNEKQGDSLEEAILRSRQ
jgi:hypothetical protein